MADTTSTKEVEPKEAEAEKPRIESDNNKVTDLSPDPSLEARTSACMVALQAVLDSHGMHFDVFLETPRWVGGRDCCQLQARFRVVEDQP